MCRWPRWSPRSSPKRFCGFESRPDNRVLWIIGSTDRHLIQLFHPGINARLRRRPANAGPATRVIVTHGVWAILLLNHVRSPVAVRPPVDASGHGAADRTRSSHAEGACINPQPIGLGFDALNGEPARSKRDPTTHDRDSLPIRRSRSWQIASALSLSPFSTPKHTPNAAASVHPNIGPLNLVAQKQAWLSIL